MFSLGGFYFLESGDVDLGLRYLLVLHNFSPIALHSGDIGLGGLAHCGQAVQADALRSGSLSWTLNNVTLFMEIRLCRVLFLSSAVVSGIVDARLRLLPTSPLDFQLVTDVTVVLAASFYLLSHFLLASLLLRLLGLESRDVYTVLR